MFSHHKSVIEARTEEEENSPVLALLTNKLINIFYFPQSNSVGLCYNGPICPDGCLVQLECSETTSLSQEKHQPADLFTYFGFVLTLSILHIAAKMIYVSSPLTTNEKFP